MDEDIGLVPCGVLSDGAVESGEVVGNRSRGAADALSRVFLLELSEAAIQQGAGNQEEAAHKPDGGERDNKQSLPAKGSGERLLSDAQRAQKRPQA